jgi:hypothetical protein
MASFAFANDFGAQRTWGDKGSEVIMDGGADSRDGGETVADAVVIPSLPFEDTGATCDNINNYDEACPYTLGTAPDVVYSFTPGTNMQIDIDLCGSGYDTKLYVYENAVTPGAPFACNDDYYTGAPCGLWVSALLGLNVTAGNTYYIVIDGYGTACGNFVLAMDQFIFIPSECAECPPDAFAEGEPDMGVDPDDVTNGGCNTDPDNPPFTLLEGTGNSCVTMCANSGWPATGRDTDWFITTAVGSEISLSVYSDYIVNMYQLAIPDCASATVTESTTSVACEWTTLTIATTPGEVVYLWVGPGVEGGGAAYDPPPGAGRPYTFTYVAEVCGIVDGVVSTENATWGNVKSLYK